MSDSLSMNAMQSKSDFENYNSKLKLTSSSDKLDEDKEENEKKRENWGNRIEFLLACIGYSVGLGNIWRFGYLCAKSGGGMYIRENIKKKVFFEKKNVLSTPNKSFMLK